MIKVLTCDGDGTLQLPSPTTKAIEFAGRLEDIGVNLTAASNSPQSIVRGRFSRSAIESPDIIVTPETVGAKKPSPKFIDYIIDHYEVERNQVAYLGDNKETDIFCAINSGILPIAAHYSEDANRLDYGLPVHSIEGLWLYLYLMGTRTEPYFGWDSQQDYVHEVSINSRALLGQHDWITDDLKTVLKDGKDIYIGDQNHSLRALLSYYLVTQCFLSGIVHDTDIISVYPGHEKGSLNSTMERFCEILNRIFRYKFKPDLFIRHEDAPESKSSGPRRIEDQLRTLHINPEYRGNINCSNVLLFDDFTTSGKSFEAARLILDQAGVNKVTCLAMAKYRATQAAADVSQDWDPFSPFDPSTSRIREGTYRGNFNNSVDHHFQKIFEYYQNK
jgi:hypothetical protein